MVLVGLLLFMISQAITYFSFCNRQVKTAFDENFEENILDLYRKVHQIDFEAYPLELKKTGDELFFGFIPPFKKRALYPYLVGKIFQQNREIFFETQDPTGLKVESIKLASTKFPLKIQILGYQFQENKRTFISLNQFDNKTSMIPVAIRLELGTKTLDIPIPLKLEDQNILHLNLTPTRSACS